jgi:hypothetical protein
MQERRPLLIPEKGADAGNFMGMFQFIFHGFQGEAAVSPGPDNQSATIVRTADNEERRRLNILIDSELLNGFVDDIAVFQPKNKYSALPCL